MFKRAVLTVTGILLIGVSVLIALTAGHGHGDTESTTVLSADIFFEVLAMTLPLLITGTILLIYNVRALFKGDDK